jgi:hypothetical protein
MSTRYFLSAMLFMLIATANVAHALPMLSEAASMHQDGILTVWPDSEDAKKFYYFPNSTRFSKGNDGIPLFNFVYWGLDGQDIDKAGAYMTLTTRLQSDDLQTDAVQKFLQRNPGATLAVAPVMKSTIGLQTTDPSGQPLSTLFKEFNFAKAGGRAEDEIGVNATLNPVGAKAFKALLTKSAGGQYLKFDYCYTLQGLGPNMKATISVKFDRVYDYFEVNGGASYLWFSASIRRVVETLKQQGFVTIKQMGGTATDAEVLDRVADTVVARLFKPELSASPGSSGEASSNFPFHLAVDSVHKEELKEEFYTWDREDLVTREFCTAVNIKDLDGYQTKLVIDADQP